jgi:hypothetical protein
MSDQNAGWITLLNRSQPRVREICNILCESPYFYREDNESAFNYLRRHRTEFSALFDTFFGWTLVIDGKCARLYKEKWYNAAVTESMRDCFNFTRRDECIAFMMLLEFFEHQLDENDLSVDDQENLRFRFGDFLEFSVRRFRELGGEEKSDRYTPEYVRSRILRVIFPVLERYRFIAKVPAPTDERITEEQTIFEALPALYHYNASYLRRNFDELSHSVRGLDSGERETIREDEDDEKSVNPDTEAEDCEV